MLAWIIYGSDLSSEPLRLRLAGRQGLGRVDFLEQLDDFRIRQFFDEPLHFFRHHRRRFLADKLIVLLVELWIFERLTHRFLENFYPFEPRPAGEVLGDPTWRKSRTMRNNLRSFSVLAKSSNSGNRSKPACLSPLGTSMMACRSITPSDMGLGVSSQQGIGVVDAAIQFPSGQCDI